MNEIIVDSNGIIKTRKLVIMAVATDSLIRLLDCLLEETTLEC